MPFNIGGFTYNSSFIENYTKGGIVTDGLILHLDSTFVNSYPKGGTTWYDLQGNYNGTLTNGPTYNSTNGGSIVFDGSNDHILTSSSALGTSSGTLCFWIKSNTASSIYNTQSASWNQNSLFLSSTDLIFRISNGTVNPGDVTISAASVFNNNYNFLCITWSVGGERAIWLNGSKQSSLTNTLQFTAGTNFEIGYVSWAGVYFNGTINIVLSYSRALTSTEILQNYNATKSRFGL